VPAPEEIRIALALNGGVSLAVWMGGCAVELDSARRAHVGPERLDHTHYTPKEGGTKERRVYNGICAAFERRLVIDILSGASAGGVNGALLGAAMTARRRLHPTFVRDSWIQLGDFSRLLHEADEKAPRALMQGELFHTDLLKAFRAVLDDEAGDGPQPTPRETAASALPEGQGAVGQEEAKLDVTMTDVRGRERVFHDAWGGDLIAQEHRLRFRFRQSEDYRADKLADAARTSASFPLAFEPWPVEGDGSGALAGLKENEETFGVDGGLLDNAPIRAALDLIPGQAAAGEVRRYVCYLNADPPVPPPGGDGDEPELKDVLGYVVTLPRVAPFVDQLYAVRDAARRAELAPLIQDELLELPLATVRATAAALMPAYRARRTAESLDELLPGQGDGDRVRNRLEQAGASLPWIPASVEPPGGGDDWDWGARPAQRVLHLLLDLVRQGLAANPDPQTHAALLELRGEIGTEVEELDHIRRRMIRRLEDGDELGLLAAGEEKATDLVDELEAQHDHFREEIYACLEKSVNAFGAMLTAHGELAPFENLHAKLFEPGDADSGWSPMQSFLARVLAIEVVRRAFAAEAEIETAQRLRFVQLTPAAPTPILSEDPFELPPAAEAGEKLTGVGLNHFAGFYRRSWRANDYMWGRLDAADRIVQVLLDGLSPSDPGAAANVLADAVLHEEAGETEAWLVREALAAQPGGAAAQADGDDLAALRTELVERLSAELAGGGEATLARAVCVRAVQLEILMDELPEIVEQSEEDRKLGSSSAALELPLGTELHAAIEELRRRRDDGRPLRKELDDGHEEVSDLGLRTIVQTALVGLGAAKGAAAPLAKAFAVARAPLQAIAGVVSPDWRYRGTVAACFWAAALYLTMRFLTAQPGEAKLSDVWSGSVLLMLIGALAVVAVVLVPGLRAWRNSHHRIRNALWAVGLALGGGVLAAILAATSGGLGVTNVVFGAGADQLPSKVLAGALVVTVGIGVLRIPLLDPWLAGKRSGWKLYVPLLLVAIAVAVFSILRLAPVLDDSCWQLASGLAALVAAGLAIAYLLPHRSPQ